MLDYFDKKVNEIARFVNPAEPEKTAREIEFAICGTADHAVQYHFGDNDKIIVALLNANLAKYNIFFVQSDLLDLTHEKIREFLRYEAEETEYKRLYSEPTPEQIAGEIQDDIISMYRRER